MTIRLVKREEEAELLLSGRLDAAASLEAESIFEELAETYERVILNLAGLDYVSSGGLRLIKQFHIRMVKKGGVLVLTNVSRMVMEVFEMTGFAGFLKIE